MNRALRIASFSLLSVACVLSAAAQQSTPPLADPPQQSAPATPAEPAQAAPPADLPDSPGTQVKPSPLPTGPTAVIDTSMGRITCKLFDKEAPKTVANFIGLAQGTKDWTDPTSHQNMHGKSMFAGTTFHRVIPEFMIQGGDPTGTGTGDPGYMFEDEFDPNLNFDVPGRLAMANSGPNTNGSQFFITEVPTEYLNQKHTIFGQCDDSGLLIVKSIARVERDPQDKPVQPVTLDKITIVQDGQAMPQAPAAPAQPQAQPATSAPAPKPQP